MEYEYGTLNMLFNLGSTTLENESTDLIGARGMMISMQDQGAMTKIFQICLCYFFILTFLRVLQTYTFTVTGLNQELPRNLLSFLSYSHNYVHHVSAAG